MPQSDNTTPHAAEIYDRAVRQTIAFYETMHEEAMDLVRTAKPDVRCWVDTGCGTGYLVQRALPVFPQARFILADPSEAMLQEARRQLREVPDSRVRFLPPLPSEGLRAYHGELVPQVITAILCHHYLPPQGRRAALRACHGLLDREGLFITFENIAPRTVWGTQIGLARWGHYQLGQGRPPSTVEDHLRRFGTAYFPVSVDEHIHILGEAGFSLTECFWTSQMQAGFYALK